MESAARLTPDRRLAYSALGYSPKTRRPLSRKNKTRGGLRIWRKEDRADHIYRIAAEIMCRKGYEATAVSDIADAVGLTKAGLYHYIRGKEDLLFQIMSFGMDMVDEDIIVPAREVAEAEARLRTIVERHVRRILEVGGAVTVLLEEMVFLTPRHQRTIRTRKRAYFELIRQTLERLAAEGKLRGVDPTVATFTLLGMINWISRWYRDDGKLAPETVASDLQQLALSAVLKERARATVRSYPAGLQA